MDVMITGLTSEEVSKRKAEGKVNGKQEVKTKSVGKILFSNIFTLFNLIFVIFAIILIIFLDKGDDGKYSIDDFSDFGFFLLMIVNAAIGIIQELKAKRTIDKLSLLSAPKVTVVRDGQEQEIMLEEIVLDDVILLSAGRQICADSIVIDGYVEVNESLITGEPDAIPKHVGDTMLSGSFVVSGNAKSKVIHVGQDNYATKISSGAKFIKQHPSEIRSTLTKFIRFMGLVIFPVGIALFAVKYWLQSNELYTTVSSVMGTLIGMIPSGLVLLTSAVFCVSVIRLSRHKALAQDLYCVETLARVDTLCLDKTGTITEGCMEVNEIVDMVDGVDVKGLINDIISATKDSNETVNALREFVGDTISTRECGNVIPFSSRYKYSGAEFGGRLYVIGAPEFVLKNSFDSYKDKINDYASNGYRVLVLASNESGVNEEMEFVDEPQVIALIVISDKIRKEAPDTIRYFAEQGVNIKIISGDNPVTVSKIAERVGIEGHEKYVDATSFTSDEELALACEEYTIFGRVTPNQKLTLIKSLRAKKHTVAMTGDGVNDVLALRESDCSIAMAAGSDAAKNVSQLVLLDNNFASLPKAVAEGRRTINNLERSASLFLVKTFYNLMFAVLFLIISTDLPFAPSHMTFISLLTIGIPSYILALEPNKELVKGKFFRKVISNALPASFTVTLSIVAASLSCSFFKDTISPEQVSTMCTIIAGFIGFIYIAKISFPYNPLRIALLAVLIGAFVGSFFIEFSWFSLPKFFGLSREFNNDMLKIMLPIMALSIPLFVGLLFLMEFVNKKLANKKIKILEFLEK